MIENNILFLCLNLLYIGYIGHCCLC